MLDLIQLVILGISAYGFYHTIQILRGGRLNFKPFNCAVCLSFWYTLIVVMLSWYKLTSILVATMFAVAITDIIKSVIDSIWRNKQ